MTLPEPPALSLPHHKLIAYELALELVTLVARIRIGEAQLRQQARKKCCERGAQFGRGCGAANARR